MSLQPVTALRDFNPQHRMIPPSREIALRYVEAATRDSSIPSGMLDGHRVRCGNAESGPVFQAINGQRSAWARW